MTDLKLLLLIAVTKLWQPEAFCSREGPFPVVEAEPEHLADYGDAK